MERGINCQFDAGKKLIDSLPVYKSVLEQIEESNSGSGSNAFANADWDTLTSTKEGSKYLEDKKKNDWEGFKEIFKKQIRYIPH